MQPENRRGAFIFPLDVDGIGKEPLAGSLDDAVLY